MTGGRSYLTRRSRSYPPLLAAIHDPPRRLYLRGEGSIAMLSGPAVAVVGTRSCSAYGAQVARRLGRELAAAGATVVSTAVSVTGKVVTTTATVVGDAADAATGSSDKDKDKKDKSSN